MSSFEIGQVPKRHPYLLADLVELCLPFLAYDELSKSDVETLIREGDLDADEDLDSNIARPGESSAEKIDKEFSWVEDCFMQLQYREAAFDSSYPFRIGDGSVLTWKANLTDEMILYLFLLVCSRLRSFPQGKCQLLASVFEKVSREAMKELLPSSAFVRIFGANSYDRQTYYGTGISDALRKLGIDLKEDVIERNILQETGTGDGGLDLVAYLSFEDPARGSLALFGQCAAQQYDWPKKVLEAHPLRFSSWLSFCHSPGNIVFIPLCYRQANGEWVKNSPSNGCVLLDRLRICKLLRGRSVLQEIRDILATGELAIARE